MSEGKGESPCDGCVTKRLVIALIILTVGGSAATGTVSTLAANASNETDKEQSIAIAVTQTEVVEIRKATEQNTQAWEDHREESRRDKDQILDAINSLHR